MIYYADLPPIISGGNISFILILIKIDSSIKHIEQTATNLQ